MMPDRRKVPLHPEEGLLEEGDHLLQDVEGHQEKVHLQEEEEIDVEMRDHDLVHLL